MDRKHELCDTLKRWILGEKLCIKLIELIHRSDKLLMLLVNDSPAFDLPQRTRPDLMELHSLHLYNELLLEQLTVLSGRPRTFVFEVGDTDPQ